MRSIEDKILNKFKKEPAREISTTELVRELCPDEYSRLIQDMKNNDKQKALHAKRRKGQLHRKILYHLNKLIDEDIIKLGSIKGKGEKYFVVNLDQGDLIINKKHRKIIISKPSISTSLLSDYEEQGIIQKYEPDSWISKLNSIMLESQNHTGINKFYNIIYEYMQEVNDCLALNNFEHMIENNSEDNLYQVLKRMDLDTKDHGRYISLLVNVKNIKDDKKIIGFIRQFAELNPSNIIVIVKISTRELRAHKKMISVLINEFTKQEIKINLHNRKIHDAPILVGKAGPYLIKEDEWDEYKQLARGKTQGLAIANTTIAIDVNRFFRQDRTAKEFRELIYKAAKTLLKISTAQKKKSDEYLKKINDYNRPYTKKFYAYSKNYLRFWNYDWREEKHEHIVELLQSSREEIQKFCSTQQTIYKACGIPFNFDIVFSSVFRKYTENLSSRRYIKMTIRKFSDYHNPEISSFISTRENLFRIMDGGDRIRFFRSGRYTADDLIREISFLMNTYELPLITYDFKERRGELKLDSFIK